jgi:hypothetical protein
VSIDHTTDVREFVATELTRLGQPVRNLRAADRDAVYYALLVETDAAAVRLLAAVDARDSRTADRADRALLAAHGLRTAPEPPLAEQCIRHQDCDRAGEHNAATRAAFERAGYRDFDGTGEAA